MNRVFITGDTHQYLDISKLNSKNFKEGKTLDKTDIMIILGDAGFIFNNTPEDNYWKNWISRKPWTTFCVQGNHEGYDELKKFPVVDFHGGKAIKVTDSLYYEIRGEIYDFGGKTYLTLGGAESTDKEFRIEHESWWSDESINENDYKNAIKNLKLRDGKIDYFLTHSGGVEVCRYLGFSGGQSDVYIDKVFENINSLKEHFCGHYHKDLTVNHLQKILYNDIIEIY